MLALVGGGVLLRDPGLMEGVAVRTAFGEDEAGLELVVEQPLPVVVGLGEGVRDIPDDVVPKCPPVHVRRDIERDRVEPPLVPPTVHIDHEDRLWGGTAVACGPHQRQVGEVLLVRRPPNLAGGAVVLEVPVRGRRDDEVRGPVRDARQGARVADQQPLAAELERPQAVGGRQPWISASEHPRDSSANRRGH